MLHSLFLALIVLLALPASGRSEDFIITVNGVTKEMDLDQEQILDLPNGTALKIKINQKEVLRFASSLFSFEHKNRYKPNQTDLGNGTKQTMIVTPLGTGIIVQEFTQLNPTHLVDAILGELTKEERDYGYKYQEKTVTKQAGGVTFKGKEAVTSYPGEEWTRSILACGGKDKGVVIITFIEKDQYTEERDLAGRLWQSLQITASGCTP